MEATIMVMCYPILEVDEIADSSIVDIDGVVGDEAVPGPSLSGLHTNQEVSFNMPMVQIK